MKKNKTTFGTPPQFVPGRQYRGLHGKVVDWAEHRFEEGLLYIHVRFLDKTELCWRISTRMTIEEGLLYIHVRFADKTELCWRIATRMTIEEGDLSDWKSGDFNQLRVFVKNERDRSV